MTPRFSGIMIMKIISTTYIKDLRTKVIVLGLFLIELGGSSLHHYIDFLTPSKYQLANFLTSIFAP